MAKPRISSYPRYRGNYWAIVAGPKDDHIKPLPLLTFVRTAEKDGALERGKKMMPPGTIVRAIPQPYNGRFEAGM